MFKLNSLRCVGFKRLNIPDLINFPDGQILIHGRNESGKSTIMEAIHYALYGLPLRPNKKASNEDLINYGSRRGEVELKFKIDDDRYTVKRTLRLKGTNLHELLIERVTGDKERITGYTNVNNVIEKELYGIDSDALLNSCMVEQKALGKLESATRSERIRAVTTLLNLEAFVDAEQDLNRNRNELERTNQETRLKLQQAEQAKKLYEEAFDKKERAEERINEIIKEMEKISKRVEELKEILSTIEEIKKIVAYIQTKKSLLEGRKGELRQVNKSLDEAIKAEKQVSELKELLPKAQKELAEATAKYEALEKLLKLKGELDNANKDSERAQERLLDARQNLEESEKAQERLESIKEEVERLKPAREANELLPKVEQEVQEISALQTGIDRLGGEKEEVFSKLEELKDAEEEIKGIEKREKTLNDEKNAISRNRNIGIVITVVGLLVSVASLVYINLLFAGIPLILIGGFSYFRYSPTKIEGQLDQVRKERERLLGDINRIEDFNFRFEAVTQDIEKTKIILDKKEENLKNLLEELPTKPRVYRELHGQGTSLRQFVRSLSDALKDDLQSFAGLVAEEQVVSKISMELNQRRRVLGEAENKHQELLQKIQEIEESKINVETEEQITFEEEDKIRSNKESNQKQVQEFEIQLETAEKKASEKEKLESESREIQELIDEIEVQIKEKVEERVTLEGKIPYTLEDEAELRSERDRMRDDLASLETEKGEREDDIKEAEKQMDENRELKEAFPELVQQKEDEVFEIESMRKSAKLLETTRDGIVSGVKKHVEKYMMQFLPSLTDNRYNMAKIDEENYRIQVYDREARRWREKGVFSGATQDQFSLALRLAFALSIIPSAMGVRPGFIFLDEPLSGFDAQRRDGLINLLKGDLSRYFEQIIIISHLEQLREEFPHSMQLEEGRILQ